MILIREKRQKMKQKKPSLIFCILMDAIGVATCFIPFLGEWGDLIWAPLSALIFYYCFGGKTGIFGAFINFAEEIIPFTDFVPTYCLGYIWTTYLEKKDQKIKNTSSTDDEKQ